MQPTACMTFESRLRNLIQSLDITPKLTVVQSYRARWYETCIASISDIRARDMFASFNTSARTR